MLRRSQTLTVWFVACDLAVTALAWLAAYALRFETGLIAVTETNPPDLLACLRQLPVVAALAAFAYHYTGQYLIHRLRRFREEVVATFRGVCLLVLLVTAVTFLLRDPYESRLTLVMFAALTWAGVLVCRRVSWGGVRWLRSRGYNQSQTLIVGVGRVARKTERSLQQASWMGFHNVGFVSDQPGRPTNCSPVLGTIPDLPRLVEELKISHVFIAVSMNQYQEARRVFDVLSRSLVEVRLILDVPNLAGLSLTTGNLDGLPVVGLRESPHFGLNVVVKRAMDVVLSALALLVLSPVFAVLAFLVKWSSPGPVFYRQVRCGLNGEPFVMYKFRTLPVDAEAQSGPVWAVKNDPRRTKLGAFLRSTSLDELPQFWNVLRGDMSLVGPRPERPVFIEKFSKSIPNYTARHCVKSGITGWAQVHGWRGNTSLRKRLQFDLYYITHWNPWLDVRILWLTVWRGLVNRNAY